MKTHCLPCNLKKFTFLVLPAVWLRIVAFAPEWAEFPRWTLTARRAPSVHRCRGAACFDVVGIEPWPLLSTFAASRRSPEEGGRGTWANSPMVKYFRNMPDMSCLFGEAQGIIVIL